MSTMNGSEDNEGEDRGLIQHLQGVVKYLEGVVQYLQRALRRVDHTFMAVVKYPCSGIIATILICTVLFVIYEAAPQGEDRRYEYIEYKQADLPDRAATSVSRDIDGKKCRKQCNDKLFCKMLVFDHKSQTCKLYDQDAFQLELVPTVHLTSSIFLRMEKDMDGFLEADGYVYWRTLTPMTYKQAQTHCRSWGYGGFTLYDFALYTGMTTFYLARTRSYNNITVNVAREYIHENVEKQKNEEGDNLGFFVVDGITSADEDNLRQKKLNNALPFPLSRGEDDELLEMGGRIVYVTADSIDEVKSENYTKGYPLCQGRPFNQEKIVIY